MSSKSIKTTMMQVVVGMMGLSFVFVAGCGGAKQSEGEGESPVIDEPPMTTEPPVMEPPIVVSPMADAGRDLMIMNSELVQLDGTLSKPADGRDEPLVFQWRQLSGPVLQFLTAEDSQSASPRFVAPSVSNSAAIELELTVSQGSASASDTVNVDVEPCRQADGLVYGDCIAPGYGPFTAYESNAARGEIHHVVGRGDYHVQWQAVDTGEAGYGQVVEITWNANDPEHTSATNGWFGVATMDTNPADGADLSRFAQGALSFDMRVVYHEAPTNPTPFIVKMECGWPCASDEMAIPGAERSYEWQTYTYSIAEMVSSGLDVTGVTFPFVIQPLWQQQEQEVTIQIDNVRLMEEYSPPPINNGCPKAGNVSYTLARSANPSADEQDAYNRITQAMDEAVKQYNCYTNLRRTLNVSYNPSVATADGNANGSIRFGSRASMHHVTAMHEISHVMGIGTTTSYRNLVQNGIYSGVAGNAQLRAISGKADDQLRSDGTHFWPHGLNYIHEGETQQDLINHCLVVEAIVSDL